ncbi:MAG: [Fe-Fe] hydrogenase large subunit C-terminal domain-containing protein [Patescibacteria group bacterium]|nr:(2Fe-2S)-binding protein [Patescibacteria group bacterium]MBU1870847.1 (2Fe-2S)-binding protein [Patescibacteria group bacterium]
MKNIKIKIDNKIIVCSSDQTIMQVAKNNNIDIPGLCNHPDFPIKANCRICLVEIKNRPRLAPSCHVKVEDGLEIKTNTERVKKARNLNLELLFAEHIEKCPSCLWRFDCPLLDLANKYKIKLTRFNDRKKTRKIYKFANAVEIDGSQCIDCRNCLNACSLQQNINYLKLIGKGIEQEIVPVDTAQSLNVKKNIAKTDCIYCGQCAVHCPVGAAQEQAHWEIVEQAINSKNKIVVVQFDPLIQAGINEKFDLPYNKNTIGQIVAGLRCLGFNYVFDVNVSTSMTAILEAQELIERLKKCKKEQLPSTNLPMFTSCCPAWVKYVEFFYPKFIPNLTITRSPHIYNGGIIKTYWAEQLKIDPKEIIVVSVMPCTAKKFEVSRVELKIKNNWPVDYVLTIRELIWMFKKNHIEFGKLKNSFVNNFFNKSTEEAVTCSVGKNRAELVLQTALNLIYNNKKNNSCFDNLNFKEVQGLIGVKEAKIKIDNKILRVAVVNGIGNIESVLNNALNYDYIEVMACPEGCNGGGGQSIPTTSAIRQKRIEAFYELDKNKKVCLIHENLEIKKIFEWLRAKPDLEHKILYTYYKQKKEKV